jgi:hypothetical protein
VGDPDTAILPHEFQVAVADRHHEAWRTAQGITSAVSGRPLKVRPARSFCRRRPARPKLGPRSGQAAKDATELDRALSRRDDEADAAEPRSLARIGNLEAKLAALHADMAELRAIDK